MFFANDRCFGSEFIDFGSGSSMLEWLQFGSRSRVRWPKMQKNTDKKKNVIFFWSKIAVHLSLGLHEGRPSYRRSFQSLKENIQHFKTWNFLTFSIFWVIFALLDQYPIRIRIRNTVPDPNRYKETINLFCAWFFREKILNRSWQLQI